MDSHVADCHNGSQPKPAARARADSATGALRPHLSAVLPHLHGRARSLCRDPVEAEDLVQDTVERALRFGSHFAPGSNVRAWMSQILQNLFFSTCRHAATERRALEWLARDPCAWVRPGSQPAMIALAPTVSSALDSLPVHHSAVVWLVDVCDYTYRDAATELRVPIGTVMSRLHRARRSLAESLGPKASREQQP